MADPYQVDVKIIQSFNPTDYSSFSKIFRNYDKNKNGVIDRNELLPLLHNLGYREMKEDDLNEVMKGIDTDNDKVVSFKEFLNFMKKINSAPDPGTEVSNVTGKGGKKFVRVENRRESSGLSYSTFSEEERRVYVKVINDALCDDEVCKKYLPIDPETNDIFDRLKNGVILCKLMNVIHEGTIDERVINTKDNMNVFQQAENINLALSAAKSLGISTVGLNKGVFFEANKNPSMVLGLMWQLAKHILLQKINLKNFPELVRLLNPGEQLSDLLKLSPEQLLLRWFNYHLKNAGYDKPITNFSGDVKDSEKYTILLNQLDKEKCDKSALNESDLNKRAAKVLEDGKKLGAKAFISPKDIVDGNSKLNTIFVAALFNACPGLDPPTEKEKMDAAGLLDDDAEGAREERAFRMWINSLNLQDDNMEPIYINNLYEESKSGILLLKTIDRIKPDVVNWKVVDKKCSNPFKIQVNCQEAVDASKKCKFSIVGIGGADIREGNKKYILAIVWQLMREHSLQVIGNKTEEELVTWGNSKVEDKFKVKSLKDKSISNSLFFIYIMKSIEPRSINWDIVIQDKDDDESKQNNAKYAISIARKLGATVFLVWEDITEVKNRLLLTFLASLYQVGQEYKPLP